MQRERESPYPIAESQVVLTPSLRMRMISRHAAPGWGSLRLLSLLYGRIGRRCVVKLDPCEV